MPPTQEQTMKERLFKLLGDIDPDCVIKNEKNNPKMTKLEAFISQELETLLNEVLTWAVKEKDGAHKESLKPSENNLQRIISQAEFGRFQAFRDVEDKLTALRRKYTT